MNSGWRLAISLAISGVITAILLVAFGVAGAADEIVLGAAISQTGKDAREGRFLMQGPETQWS